MGNGRFLLLLALICHCAAGAQAAGEDAGGKTGDAEAPWRKIREADGAVELCVVQWQCVSTDRFGAGTQRTSEIFIKRQGSVAVGEIATGSSLSGGTQVAGAPKFPTLLEFLDDNARLSATLRLVIPAGITPPPATAEEFAQCRWAGAMHRVGRNDLLVIGLHHRRFLAAAPLFKEFTPGNSTLRPLANGRYALEKRGFLRGETERGETEIAVLEKWEIDGKTGRPLSQELLWDEPNDKHSHLRRYFENYRQFGEVWFPTTVREENGAPRKETGQAWRSDEYKLISAKFNRDVDASGWKCLLPKGATITDKRFAPRPAAHYVVKDAIPGDDFVLEQIAQSELAEMNARRDAPPAFGKQR